MCAGTSRSGIAFAAARDALISLGLDARRFDAGRARALGMVDDYATRHALEAEIELTAADDFGTRNQPAAVELTAADDFGTRHAAKAIELGPDDDWATRQVR